MRIHTKVVLSTQFSNMFEGPKPASETYSAEYVGDDTAYLETYTDTLVDSRASQADFWDCVEGYKESYSVSVTIEGDHVKKAEIEKHLTDLVTADMVNRLGRTPESSFHDDMSEEKKREIEKSLNFLRTNYPGLCK